MTGATWPRSRRYLTSCDIGEILRLSPSTVQGLLVTGEIPSTMDNGHYRVEEAAFRRYLRTHTVPCRRPRKAGATAAVAEQAALVMLRLAWGDAYRDFRVEHGKWSADSPGGRTVVEASAEALNLALRADWARQVMA